MGVLSNGQFLLDRHGDSLRNHYFRLDTRHSEQNSAGGGERNIASSARRVNFFQGIDGWDDHANNDFEYLNHGLEKPRGDFRCSCIVVAGVASYNGGCSATALPAGSVFRRKTLAMSNARKGFTLVEVLVVIAILGLLLALLLPALNGARDAARRVECANHQHNLALAMTRFELDKGQYPGYRNLQAIDKDDIGRPTGWAFPLLPYLEFQMIYDQHGPKGPDDYRGTLPNFTLPLLICPADAMIDARNLGVENT